MAKRFVKITQTFTCTAIMDISPDDTPDVIIRRIKNHCENNGGPETVICDGGNIDYTLCCEADGFGTPTSADEEKYECID